MEILVHYGVYWLGISLVGGIVGKIFGFGFWRSFFTCGGLYILFTVVRAATRSSS